MSLVDQVRRLELQVVDRLKELEPLAREYDQLRKVAQRLGLKYTPGSATSDDGAGSSTTRRRTSKRAPAAKRPSRKPAKAQVARPRGRGAAKASAKPRGPRSTTAPRAKSSAQASGGNGTASRERPGKRAATSRQRSGGRRAAARPGQRQDDVLRLVRENPGITVRELGERLGVDATGLYRVVNRLADEGRVRKDGARLEPVDSSTTAASEPQATAKSTPAVAGTQMPEAT
jgi:hypothetical protein